MGFPCILLLKMSGSNSTALGKGCPGAVMGQGVAVLITALPAPAVSLELAPGSLCRIWNLSGRLANSVPGNFFSSLLLTFRNMHPLALWFFLLFYGCVACT